MANSQSEVPEHVAIYLPSLRGGGAERIMVTVANALVAKGVKVDLVLARAEGPYLRDVASDVRVIDLRSSRVITSLPSLVKYLRRRRPVAMLSALSHANVVAALARTLSRVPSRLVVSERNMISTGVDQSLPLNRRLVLATMRWAYSKADNIVAVSDSVAQDLSRFIGIPRDSVLTVYNPIDLERIHALSLSDVDHPWFDPEGPPVVLGVGRLTRQKDFSTLLRAFARVREHRPVRLLILGEGELREDLEAEVRRLRLSEDVQLPGFFENPYAYMRRSSVFVLSSAWEGLPGALLEAMACGSPVISTDCPGGSAEILENGKWGKLVPVGDSDSLADAIRSTLEEREHPEVMNRAAEFGVDRAIDGYLTALGGR